MSLFFCALLVLLTKATQDVKALGGQPGLREHAAARNFIIGVGTSFYLGNPWFEEGYEDILAGELNSISFENHLKWGLVHPERYEYNFWHADKQVAFAEANSMALHGHTLMWHMQNPTWLTERSWSQTELKQVLEDHIKTVVGRYKGKIKYWDVVNEAYDYNTNLRNEFWYRNLGEEAIELAFKWAREADPDAKLYYNDNGMISSSTRSIDLVNKLNSLRQRGVPIDGVGFQAHLRQDSPPSYYQMKQNLARFTNAGYEVQITELDIAIAPSVCGNQAYDESQAQIYRDLLKACLDTPGCKGLTTWGFSDKHSWLKDQCPLPLDQNYQPKPAYFAMYEELGGSYYSPTCTGMSFSVTCAPEGGSYKVYAEGVSSASHTKFPTWDEEGGQDDIVWYDGVNEGNDRWSITINQTNHPGSKINTHIYLYSYDSEPIFCTGGDIPKCDPGNPIPNCSNISGPSTLTLGESGTYSADFFSEQGSLGGSIFYNNLNRIEYRDLPGTNGSFSTEWQPSAEGTYNVCCRAWNNAIAECRPPDLVDGPPRYDCQGPNYCMTVNVAKSLLPGDINGDRIVNIQDYILLSNAFGTNDEAADLDGNGIVNIQDFIILSNNFGKTN